MAAPGLGVGDIVKACDYIYTICKRYRDAHDEFDEIADKAKSTAVVLEQLEKEAQTGGSLVERTGAKAYEQLNGYIEKLRDDAKTLEELIRKYKKIESDGPGRRLMWAVWESGNLTDLRRRIGYHEQTLQLWYMTLVHASLRRLEGGQEDIIKALKEMPFYKLDEIKAQLNRGDKSCLTRELSRSGVRPDAITQNLDTAIEYLDAEPKEKLRMESRASRASAARETYNRMPYNIRSAPFIFNDELYPPPSKERRSSRHRCESRGTREKEYIHKPDHGPQDKTYKTRENDFIIIKDTPTDKQTPLSRSRSTTTRPKPKHSTSTESPPKSPRIIIDSGAQHSPIVERRLKYHEDTNLSKPRDRRSSDITRYHSPGSPLLVVPSPGSASGSASGSNYSVERGQYSQPLPYRADQTQTQTQRPSHRRAKSADVRPRDPEDYEIVIVKADSQAERSWSRRRAESEVEEPRRVRDSSTHSYVRVRSGSRESERGEKSEKSVRVVQRLDRIDSVPIDPEK